MNAHTSGSRTRAKGAAAKNATAASNITPKASVRSPRLAAAVERDADGGVPSASPARVGEGGKTSVGAIGSPMELPMFHAAAHALCPSSQRESDMSFDRRHASEEGSYPGASAILPCAA